MSAAKQTRHAGNIPPGKTPYYVGEGQPDPEYDQGHSCVVWYDDLYNLAMEQERREVEARRAELEALRNKIMREPISGISAESALRTVAQWIDARLEVIVIPASPSQENRT